MFLWKVFRQLSIQIPVVAVNVARILSGLVVCVKPDVERREGEKKKERRREGEQERKREREKEKRREGKRHELPITYVFTTMTRMRLVVSPTVCAY